MGLAAIPPRLAERGPTLVKRSASRFSAPLARWFDLAVLSITSTDAMRLFVIADTI